MPRTYCRRPTHGTFLAQRNSAEGEAPPRQQRPGVSAPILTSNWVASSGDKWTVPLGAGGGKLFRLKELPGGDNLGKLSDLPVNTQLQAFYNVVRPDDAATWQLRVQIQFLFPK